MFARRLAALLLLASALPAWPQGPAQQAPDRRDFDQPEIVVDAGGRYGTCDVVAFAPDGSFLLAAGDDKVARLWPYAKDRLGTRPGEAEVLRWPSWREQRGGIKDVAIAKDGKTFAVGGFGMRPSTVAVIARERGETLHITWPVSRNGIDDFNVVKAVAFHPDGKRVAFGTSDGSLWFWTPKKLAQADANGRTDVPPVRAGKHEPLLMADGKPGFNYPRRLWFPDANTLVSVAESGQVLACDLNAEMTSDPAAPIPAGKTLFCLNDGQAVKLRVFRAEVSEGGKYLAAAMQGPALMKAGDGPNACAAAPPPAGADGRPRLVVRDLNGNVTATIPLGDDQTEYARSLAWQPKTHTLAIGVAHMLPGEKGKPRFYAEARDSVRTFIHPGTKPGPAFDLPGRAECMAYHPTENRLAVAGGDGDEVTLYDPAAAAKPLAVVRSQGRKPWGLKLSKGGTVVAVQTERDAAAADPTARGTGAWHKFDLSHLATTADDKIEWAAPATMADGWRVVPGPDRMTWYAERAVPGSPPVKVRLVLDRDRDLAPTCYAFLPAKGNTPTRLIVGHYYGASLFVLADLPRPDETGVHHLPKSRLFTGHSGEVVSVAAAADGTWFVTGGADQTVAAFRLAPWDAHPTFGASFEAKAGGPTVTAVDVGSPAWEAGLQAGDVLDLLAVGGKRPPVYDRRAGQPAVGSAEAAVAALNDPAAGVELFFGLGVDAKGLRREGLSSVRQRPLWKWFAGFENGRLSNWAVWVWHGSYYACKTAHGDRLVGWHVNSPDPGGTPTFHPLHRFQEQLHNPPAVQQVIADKAVAAALKEAQGNNPLPRKFGDQVPNPIALKLGGTVLGAKGLAVGVAVEKRGNNRDLLPERVELWVNDFRLKEWKGLLRDEFKPDELVIPAAAFRPGDNQVTVMTFNKAGGRGMRAERVRNPAGEVAANLLALSVGINDYADHRKVALGTREFGDLKSAVNDAEKLHGRWEQCVGKKSFFPQGVTALRVNAKASRKELTDQLAAFQTAKPTDWLVVFFAGHGDLILPGELNGKLVLGGSNGLRGALAGRAGDFFMCGPDYSPLRAAQTGLSARELFEALALVNCRKLVLLDACHAGQASDANMLRRFVPDDQGPLVMAACEQGELSLEDPAFGHGLFTYAVLEALGPQFERVAENGVLTADRLFWYVRDRMKTLLTKIKKPDDAQNPICFPQDLPAEALLKPQ